MSLLTADKRQGRLDKLLVSRMQIGLTLWLSLNKLLALLLLQAAELHVQSGGTANPSMELAVLTTFLPLLLASLVDGTAAGIMITWLRFKAACRLNKMLISSEVKTIFNAVPGNGSCTHFR